MSVHFVFIQEINLVLFLRVCEVTTSWKCQATGTFTCCCWKINKLDTVLFVSVICIPLLFDWIPFTTVPYGPFGGLQVHWLENKDSNFAKVPHTLCMIVTDNTLWYGRQRLNEMCLNMWGSPCLDNRMIIATDMQCTISTSHMTLYSSTVTVILAPWHNRDWHYHGNSIIIDDVNVPTCKCLH